MALFIYLFIIFFNNKNIFCFCSVYVYIVILIVINSRLLYCMCVVRADNGIRTLFNMLERSVWRRQTAFSQSVHYRAGSERSGGGVVMRAKQTTTSQSL